MKTVQDLKAFVKRYFPQGYIEEDGLGITIYTGLSEDPVSKRLVSVDEDAGVPEEKPVFGRYRAE